MCSSLKPTPIVWVGEVFDLSDLTVVNFAMHRTFRNEVIRTVSVVFQLVARQRKFEIWEQTSSWLYLVENYCLAAQ